MQGPSESALLLVAVGNAYLHGRDVSGFWPKSSMFAYTRAWEFRCPPPARDAEAPLLAADPPAWFAQLKRSSRRGLRLHHVPRERGPSQRIDAPDRMLAAFVGGGPRWLVEAVGGVQSQLWEGFDRYDDTPGVHPRPWIKTSLLVGEAPANEMIPVDLDVALSDLRVALTEIEAFAEKEGLDNFAACFRSASVALETGRSEPAPWRDETLQFTEFDQRERTVFQAIEHAWVFGGMGSWNDLGYSGEPYDGLSDRLYDALNDAIAGLANATFRG